METAKHAKHAKGQGVTWGVLVAYLGVIWFVRPLTASAQSDYSIPYTFTTLAGNGANRCVDGTGRAAGFSEPVGLAVDGGGNLYVAEHYSEVIRKISSSGVVVTWAGSAYNTGSGDGTGDEASFDYPSAVTVDSAGNVFVVDTQTSIIRKITPSRVVTTLAGLEYNSGSTDGTGSAARFNQPEGIAVDGVGNVYVADSLNNTIRRITPNRVVSTLAGLPGNSGKSDGTGSAARFSDPEGLAVDEAGNVYVADSGNHTIRKMAAGGGVSTLAGRAGSWGSADGSGGAAQFLVPAGVAVDGLGNVYVADTGNHTIRKIGPNGKVTTLAGSALNSGNADGIGSAVRFDHPWSVAVDSTGNVYVADRYNNTIRKGWPTPLTITVGPESLTALTGTNVSFNAIAIGALPIGRQWVWNSTPLPGATNANLILTNVQPNQAGMYSVVVSNASGSVTSLVAMLMVLSPVRMGIEPGSSGQWTTNVGANVNFTATALTTGALHYQWSKDGLAIDGATNATLVLTNVQFTNAASYSIWATNQTNYGMASVNLVVIPSSGLQVTVTNGSEASLRGALRAGGSVMLAFDGVMSLNQTITITNDAVLDGSDHSVVISGQNLVRVFTVSSNAHLTLVHLTVANGCSDQGGGLYNDGGTVTALNCIFSCNQAVGPDGTNGVGMVFPNVNTPGGPGGQGFGGAIYNRGVLMVTNALFSSNYVSGGNGGSGGWGVVHIIPPGITSGSGGSPGGPGGSGAGGAVYNLGAFRSANSTFYANVVKGGQGGAGSFPTSTGTGGAAGEGAGGGLWNGNGMFLVNCTFYGNQAIGGAGGTGGSGGGADFGGRPIAYPGAAADGGNGGHAYGGALFNSGGNLQVLSCTLSVNGAVGGSGGAGGSGSTDGHPGAQGQGRL